MIRSTLTAVLTTALLGSAAFAAAGTATAAVAPTTSERAGQHTTLTYRVENCEGCRVSLHQALRHDDGDVTYWNSTSKKVHDGEVTFTPATKRLHGITTTVIAPWEGTTGYLTEAVYRYQGKAAGDAVTFRQARGKKHGSACWAGTDATSLTLDLVIRKVRVEGTTGRTDGTIAFLTETQRWMDPMQRTWKGVLGTQDVDVCE